MIASEKGTQDNAIKVIRVILADDVADLRHLIRLELSLDGRFDVVGEAEDGAQAVEIAEELQPDVALLDLAMPVMDGLSAIPEIHKASPKTRIVIFSGFLEEKLKETALSLTADDYIEKGTKAEELSDRLAEVYASPRKSTS